MTIAELLQQLAPFDATTLPWVFMIIVAVLAFYFISKEKMKNTQKSASPDIVEAFNKAIVEFRSSKEAMKQMSNDNMHELSNSVLKIMDERFKSIETMIQNDVVYSNRNLVSGVRDEIKIATEGWSSVKGEVRTATDGLNKSLGGITKVVKKFDRLCSGCQYKKNE